MQFRFSAPSALLVAVAALAGCSRRFWRLGQRRCVRLLRNRCEGALPEQLQPGLQLHGLSAHGYRAGREPRPVLQPGHQIRPPSPRRRSNCARPAAAAGRRVFVDGSRVEFVPTLLVSGGQTFFGFKPGETLTMTLPGRPSKTSVTVRSTSGEPFKETLTCTLVANQGIVDHNGVRLRPCWCRRPPGSWVGRRALDDRPARRLQRDGRCDAIPCRHGWQRAGDLLGAPHAFGWRWLGARNAAAGAGCALWHVAARL